MGILNVVSIKRYYTYKEIKKFSDEELEKRCRGIIIDDDEDFDIYEMHRYLKIMKTGSITCHNYNQALKIKNIKDSDKSVGEFTIRLADDYEMKDRSYIDATSFEKSGLHLLVPLNYVMWNVEFEDEINVYAGGDLRYKHDQDLHYAKKINKDNLKEVHRICQMITDFPEKLTDVERIIIICNYIERYCQFIQGEQSDLLGNKFQLDDKILLEQFKDVLLNDPFTSLFRNFGVCRTFAQAITLLLNNPYMRINVHILKGGDHVWNSIELDEKSYQLDVTRCISRSKYRDENSIKTLKFDMNYILFGTDFSGEVRHESVEGYFPKELSKKSFNQDYLRAAFEHLEETGMINFDYSDEKIPYAQHKI